MVYMDVRKPLPVGTILISSNGDEFTITDENVGKGGNSLIYAARKNNSERTFVIKECFPLDERYSFVRTDSGSIVSQGAEKANADIFLKKQFEKMYEECTLGQKIAEVSGRTIAPLETIEFSRMVYLGSESEVKQNSFIIMEQYANKSLHVAEILDQYKGKPVWTPLYDDSISHNERPDLSVILNIISELLKAVKTVHRENYIHGDIHLENVLFVEPFLEYGDIGTAHLIDFSSARKLHSKSVTGNLLETDEIVNQEIFTTDGYTAPEIIFRNDGHLRLTPATDVYSVGCFLVVLIRGKEWLNSRIEKRCRPGYMRPAIDISDSIASRELNLTGLDMSVLNRLNAIIKKSLRKDPEQRYSNADEMLKEIELLYDEVTKTLTLYYRRKEIESVGHYNLWSSSKLWIEEVKKGTSRFSGYKIIENLLPSVTFKESSLARRALPIYVSGEKSETSPIVVAIKNSKRNLYLIGEGGIGKTTSLLHIMESEYIGRKYNPKAIVPIFIELSNAPDSYDEKIYRNNASTFIRRSIYDLLLQRVKAEHGYIKENSFTDSMVVEKIDHLFSIKNENPEYLLLLDGLNEVSRIDFAGYNQSPLNKIIHEIQNLMEKPNVRIVLTSRSEEKMILTKDNLDEFLIVGLDENVISEYLSDDPDLENVMENRQLLEILKIPFFLHLYRAIKDRKKMDVCTQGELLRIFFHERSNDATLYTEQAQAKHIQNDLFAQKEMLETFNVQARVNEMMHCFILDFVLPEIGWYMEREHIYHLSKEKILGIINRFLDKTTAVDLYGDAAEVAFFDKYGEQYNYGLIDTVDGLKALGTKYILDYCVNTLRILTEHCVYGRRDGTYEFLHQHFRDYNAAVKNVNQMFLASFWYEQKNTKDKAFECLSDINQRPISNEISRFIGEYLAEYKNAPYYDDGKWTYYIPAHDKNRWLLTQMLSVYRGIFDGEVEYGVYNLVKILVESRKSLSALNLSMLDLRECELNDVDLYNVDFSESLINHHTIFSSGHTSTIYCMAFSTDGLYYFTGSVAGSLQMWNAHTYKLIKTIKTYTGQIVSLSIYNDCAQFVIAVSTRKTVELIKLRLERNHSITIEEQQLIKHAFCDVQLSHDGKYLVTTVRGCMMKVFSVFNGLKSVAKFGELPLGFIDGVVEKGLVFQPNKEILTFWGFSTKLKWLFNKWKIDATKNTYEKELHKFKEKVGIWSFDINKKAYVNFIDSEEIWDSPSRIWNITYSESGNFLLINGGDKICIYDMTNHNRQYLDITDEKDEAIRALFVKKDKYLVIGMKSGTLCFYELCNGKYQPYCSSSIFREGILDICATDDKMIVCSRDGSYAIGDLENLQALKIFEGNWQDRIKICSHPTNVSLMLVSGVGGYTQIWNTTQQRIVGKVNDKYTLITETQFSPDGMNVFSGDIKGNLCVSCISGKKRDCNYHWESFSEGNIIERIIFNHYSDKGTYQFITIDSHGKLYMHKFLIDEYAILSIDLHIKTRNAVFSLDGQYLYVCGCSDDERWIDIEDGLWVIETCSAQIIKEYPVPDSVDSFFERPYYPVYVIAVSNDESWIILERKGPIRYVFDIKEKRYLSPLETLQFFENGNICESCKDFGVFHVQCSDIKETVSYLLNTIPIKIKAKMKLSKGERIYFTENKTDNRYCITSNTIEIWDDTRSIQEGTIPITNYLNVQGARFYDLNPLSDLTHEDLETIQKFGGKV